MSLDLIGLMVGFPEEWRLFFERHPKWPTSWTNLGRVFEQVFNRNVELRSRAEMVVFFMGRLCVEDFREILLLAANGYGFGAMKILRGLYERVVTMAYISGNPNEATAFLEYHYIHRGRMLRHAESFFGDLEGYIGAAEIAETKADFDTYRDRFMKTKCEKCNTKTQMHSWSKLDLASMAKKTGLHHLYFPGYYYPTMQAHATTASMIDRLESNELNPVAFDKESQPDAADRCLIIAHELAIHLVRIQNQFFGLSLVKELETLNEDYTHAWTTDAGKQQA